MEAAEWINACARGCAWARGAEASELSSMQVHAPADVLDRHPGHAGWIAITIMALERGAPLARALEMALDHGVRRERGERS